MAANWALIQGKNTAKPPNKKAPEGASCGTCDHFKKLRCKLKKKPVKHYNICGEWIRNQNPVNVLKDIAKQNGNEICEKSFDAWTKHLNEKA